MTGAHERICHTADRSRDGAESDALDRSPENGGDFRLFGGKPDFRFRLVGSRINSAFERELAGPRLADVLNHRYSTDPMNGRFFTAAQTGRET